MLIPPKYTLTPAITQCLQTIEAAKSVIDAVTIPPEVETNIRRQSYLKSSLFSARIEGIPLTLDEITGRPSNDQKKREVHNILKALEMVRDRGARDVSMSFLLNIHQRTMQDLGEKGTVGKLRTETSAIFNSAGIAVYIPPPPRQIKPAMERLIKFINSDKEQFAPIRAVLAHYTFEKIHPFLDGNGRVGRLLLQEVLEKTGYGMRGLITVEEYLAKHRNDYYSVLMLGDKDVTDYVEFMLEAIAQTAEAAKKTVLNKQHVTAEDYLLPRRAEILNIIKDHKLVNFDMLRRRFLKVNERTLRYDLKQLQNAGLIKKLGTTKGVYYEVANSKL